MVRLGRLESVSDLCRPVLVVMVEKCPHCVQVFGYAARNEPTLGAALRRRLLVELRVQLRYQPGVECELNTARTPMCRFNTMPFFRQATKV